MVAYIWLIELAVDAAGAAAAGAPAPADAADAAGADDDAVLPSASGLLRIA